VIVLIRLRVLLIFGVLVLALFPGTALAAPDNDEFANAEFVNIGDSASGSNVDAGADGEPQPCDVAMEHTIWYRVTGTGGPVTLNTVGSDVDTVLAVYDTDGDDNGPPTEDNEIDCNNDIWPDGDNQDDRSSELVFPTEDGVGYLVQIGNCPGCGSGLPDTGGVEFVAFDTPANDDRGSAQPITAGHGVLAANFGATTEPGERVECGADHDYGKTVWFRFTAPQSGNAVFTTGGGFDAVMAIYRGATHLGCNDDGVPGAVGPSRLALHLQPGDYLIQVGGWGGDIRSAYGNFSIQVDFTGDPPADRDGDGIPDAADHCPDQNSRARDANADGCLDPPPPVPLKVLRSTISIRWDPFSHAPSTRLTRLRVKAVPAGTVVKVACKPKKGRKGCPYRSKSYRIRKATKNRNLRKPFKRKLLRPGTTVTITITGPGYEGKVWRYKTRRKKDPTSALLCLEPGAKRPGSCL
jgi:hypothetical protein